MTSAFATPRSVAEPTFRDVADAVGVRFVHAGWNLSDPDPRFPEIMGGGACWFDYNGDGWPDLFLVNSRSWHDSNTTATRPTSHLYENLGDGTFRDVTDAAGVRLFGWYMGCSVADYDNDGWKDLFVSGYGANTLFHNAGNGTFTNVTAAANVSGAGLCAPFPCWGVSSAWGDYDLDGRLDLYVGDYVQWNTTNDQGNGPKYYSGERNVLWHNNGDGTFTDATAAANATDAPGLDHSKTLGVLWFDYNADGCPDLYLASDETDASLLENDCHGHFTDVAKRAHATARDAGMGLASGDTNGDGWPDLYKTHYELEHNAYLVGAANGTFTDKSGAGDLADDLPFVGWGTGIFDFNNDGAPDIYAVDGHTQSLSTPFFNITAPERNLLFLNRGDATFRDATNASGPGFRVEKVSRGSAVADYDHDGALDIAVVNTANGANGNGTADLLRGGNETGRWLDLTLREAGANRDAIGAKAAATLAGGRVETEWARAGSSYESQDDLALHFGLGDATHADVTVTWPDGTRDTYSALAANQTLILERGGAVVNDTLAPTTQISIAAPAGANDWLVGTATVSLVATDHGLNGASGVARTEVAIDGGAWQDYAGPFTFGDGAHRVLYRSVDRAGNVEATHDRHVRVDSVPPVTQLTVDGTAGSGGWYVSAARVTLAATDATSGVARTETSLDGGAWVAYAGPFTLSDGAHSVAYRAFDVAGNVEATRTVQVPVDTQPPTSRADPFGTRGANGWFTGPASVVLSASDAVSGAASTTFSLDGATRQLYTAPLALGEGSHTLVFASTDRAGNVESDRRLTVLVDATPPATSVAIDGTIGAHGWFVSSPRVTLVASDATSGVARSETRLDGAAWRTYVSPFTLADGVHSLAVRSVDVAGNVEPATTLAVDVDTLPPVTGVVAISHGGNTFENRSLLSLVATDAVSGVASTSFSLDGGAWQSYVGPFAAGEGTHVLSLSSVDVAGNVEPAHSTQVTVDTTPPTTWASLAGARGEAGWFVSNVTVALAGSDALSGLGRIDVALDGSTWAAYGGPFTLAEGTHRFEFRGTDFAGNVEAPHTQSVGVDTTPPSVALVAPDRGSLYVEGSRVAGPGALPRGLTLVAGDVEIEADASDATSGVARVEFRVDGALVATVFSAPFRFEWDGANASAGNHSIEARAVDVAGNVAAVTRNLTVVPTSEAGLVATVGAVPAPSPLAAPAHPFGPGFKRWTRDPRSVLE